MKNPKNYPLFSEKSDTVKLTIKPEANQIIHRLQAHGYEAYAVGGCVRNALLGLCPHDWDICTNAKPDEMRAVFRDYTTHDFGLKHGTLVVMAGEEPYEVTTYRIDGVYADNRHPEQVRFTDDLTLDLSRRDFTVNAMAYNDEQGFADPFGGREDLRNGILRCVGNPDRRFAEDSLRIMRGVRFAATYGFSVERQTAQAIHRNAALLQNIAAERIRVELTGAVCGEHVLPVFDEFRDVLATVIPELRETFDFEQRNKHHAYDVWGHILHAVAAIENDPLLRVTMLFHDIGKPRACTADKHGCRHFKGHQQISADMASVILKRLTFPNAFIADCLQLIIAHDIRFDGSQRQVKRVLQKLGEENMRRLFAVQRADVAAQSDYHRTEKLSATALAERQFEELVRSCACVTLRGLAVNGSDLMALGFKEGRAVGTALNRLLDAVIDGELPNEREKLLQRAAYIKNKG